MDIETHEYACTYWLTPSLLGSVEPDPLLVETGAIDYLPTSCRDIELNRIGLSGYHRIPIPDDLLAHLKRPTPLERALAIEAKFAPSAKIFLKREDRAPSGSLKYNAAVVGCYLAAREGAREVVACSMAGNWAVAVALAAQKFGLRCRIFMTSEGLAHRSNLAASAHRLGAVIVPTKSGTGDIGAVLLASAVDDVRGRAGAHLIVGCVGNHPAAFQSVIGMEAAAQLRSINEEVDLVVSSASGGTGIAGMFLGFAESDSQSRPDFLIAESADFAELADHQVRTSLHSVYSGLNTRCRNPIARYLLAKGDARAVGIAAERAREAAQMLDDLEGIGCAEETGYAVAAAIGELHSHAAVMICISGGAENRRTHDGK